MSEYQEMYSKGFDSAFARTMHEKWLRERQSVTHEQAIANAVKLLRDNGYEVIKVQEPGKATCQPIHDPAEETA